MKMKNRQDCFYKYIYIYFILSLLCKGNHLKSSSEPKKIKIKIPGQKQAEGFSVIVSFTSIFCIDSYEILPVNKYKTVLEVLLSDGISSP